MRQRIETQEGKSSHLEIITTQVLQVTDSRNDDLSSKRMFMSTLFSLMFTFLFALTSATININQHFSKHASKG